MTDWTIHDLLPAEPAAPLTPDRGGYTLTMRECSGAEDVLRRLELAERGSDRVHMGWGSFRNLDIAAARRSSWMLLMDVNVHQFRVWDAVRSALCDPAVTDAASFVGTVTPLLPHTPRLRQFSTCTRTWLMGDLERPGSWLFAERPERFAWVQDLFRAGRVATGCMDLRGAAGGGGDAFGDLAGCMAAAAARRLAAFDTLYVSNIPWMMAQDLGFFGESHDPYLAAGEARVLDRVHANLAEIAPVFGLVVSSAHLRPDATAANLQWHTQILTPSAFVDDGYWRPLAPIAPA
ncbi:MAG: hypothetical protein AB7O49_04635 [Sphingomonadales bacterium]